MCISSNSVKTSVVDVFSRLIKKKNNSFNRVQTLSSGKRRRRSAERKSISANFVLVENALK